MRPAAASKTSFRKLKSPSAFSLEPAAFVPVPPISSPGNVNEISGRFGGADRLRSAVNQLQSLLYA
jgi:hypothetical protein